MGQVGLMAKTSIGMLVIHITWDHIWGANQLPGTRPLQVGALSSLSYRYGLAGWSTLRSGRQEGQQFLLLGFSPSRFTPGFQVLCPPPLEPPPSLPPQSTQMTAMAKVKTLASRDPLRTSDKRSLCSRNPPCLLTQGRPVPKE